MVSSQAHREQTQAEHRQQKQQASSSFSIMRPLLQTLTKIHWKLWVAGLAGMLTVLIVALGVLVRTDWFQDQIRHEIIVRLQETTNGTVKIGSLSLDPTGLTNCAIVLRNVSLARSDENSYPPFLKIPSLRLDVGIESLLWGNTTLRSMEVESPRVELVTIDGGLTNLPSLGGKTAESSLPAAWLDLIGNQLSIRKGYVSWNGVQLPMSLTSEQFSVETRFERVYNRYRTHVKLENWSAQVDGYKPIFADGDLEFLLYRDHLEASQILLTIDKSQVEAKLRIDDFDHLRIDVDYQLHAELHPWAKKFKIPTVKRGRSRVIGKASWDVQREKFEYGGRLEIDGLSIRSNLAAVEQVGAVARYEGNNRHVALHDLEVYIPGGRFSGEVNVEVASDFVPRYAVAGSLDLEFPLALEFLELPFGRAMELPWSSTVTGQLRGTGIGADELTTTLSLQLTAPDTLEEGQSPLSGEIDLAYGDHDHRDAISSILQLSTPSLDFNVTGTFSLVGRSSLVVHAKTKSPDGLAFLAKVATPQWSDSITDLAAEMSFDGNLWGHFFSEGGPTYELKGRAQASHIRLMEHYWESFKAEVSVHPDQLHIRRGLLQDGDAKVIMSTALPLERGSLAHNLPLNAYLSLTEVPLDWMVPTVNWEIPILGQASGTIQLTGSVSQPEGSATVKISEGKAWGQPFDLLVGEIELGEEKIILREFELTHQDAEIRAMAQFEPSERRFLFNLEGNDWKVEQLHVLPPSFGGELKFQLGGSGRFGTKGDLFEQFVLSGLWDIGSLRFNQQPIGSFKGDAKTVGAEVTLDWQAELLNGHMDGTAHVYPTENGRSQGRTQFTGLDLVALAQLSGVSLDKAIGVIDGHCTFYAASWGLNDLMAEGQVTRLDGEFAAIPDAEKHYSIWNPFPMRWGFARNTLRFDRMRLLGEGTDVEINGEVSFLPEGPLDVDISGTFNLAVLGSFRPDLQAHGSSTLEIAANGSIKTPNLTGRMELKNASLRSIHFANGLNQLKGVVTLTGKHIQIDEVTAISGGGQLQLSGNGSFDAKTITYRVNIEAEKVRLRYPTSVSSLFDGQLTLSGTGVQSLVEGKVVVHRAAIEQKLELGVVLASLGEPTPTPPSNPLLENMQLDIQIHSVPNLQLETSLVEDIQGHIDFRLAGSALAPSLLGRASITQGAVYFRGSRYIINSGDIEFNNPFRVEPTVNFELESRLRDVDIALTLSGPAHKMNLSYRSDPPLQFNELVYLIASGRDPGDPVFAAQQALQQQHLFQTGANNVVSQVLAQPGSRRMQRFFGVSRLKVDPRAGGVEFNPSARISTDQPIGNNLILTYSYDLSSAQQQTVRLEWAPTRRWSMIVTRDENGLVGADFIYKKRLR